MRKFAYFLLGAVIGGAVGSALAILFAPAPGTVLQEQVVAKLNAIRQDVKQAAVDRRIQLEGELDTLRRPQA